MKLVLKSSNKPQTAEKQASDDTIGRQVGPIITLTLDKVSFLLSPPSEAERAAIHRAVYSTIDDKETFKDARRSGLYKLAKSIVIPGSDERVYFEANPKLPALAYCRFEFNAAALGPEGLDGFHAEPSGRMDPSSVCKFFRVINRPLRALL